MFLRGYGSQDYAQANSYYLSSADGLVPEEKTNTTYKSGELGKVQGDAVRWWQFTTSAVLTVGNPWESYFSKPSKPFYDASGVWKRMKDSKEQVTYVCMGNDFFDTSYPVQLPINLKHYKYSIGSMSPCGIASINEEITGPMEGEIYTLPLSVAQFAGGSPCSNPIAEEIRPVNVAVRYYIKAK